MCCPLKPALPTASVVGGTHHLSFAKTPSGDEENLILIFAGGSKADFPVWKGTSTDKPLSLSLHRANGGRSAETLYPSFFHDFREESINRKARAARSQR